MDRPPGGSKEGGKLRGSSGSTDNPTSEKCHFCIIQTMLNKINKKKFKKSFDLGNFVNFSDLPQGGRGVPPHPLLANPGYNFINN